MKKNGEEHGQIYIASFFKKLQAAGADFVFFHVPNGGSRNKAEGGKLRLMGVLPGVPDIIIIYNKNIIFWELKDEKGGLSKAQEVLHSALARYGFNVQVSFYSTPQEAVKAAAEISASFADQKAISQSMSSVLASLPPDTNS